MAKKKFDLITELYAEAVREVTATPDNWKAFLRLLAVIIVFLLMNSF